jgi:hypothetical protein
MVALICLVVFLVILTNVVRYVSQTALIQLVDRYETSGEQASFRQGLRLGWSRQAWRMFLIDLLVFLALLLTLLLALLIVATPLLLYLTQQDWARILGTVVAGALALVVAILTVLVVIALSLLLQFVHRAVVLEDLGVMDALRRGWAVLRGRLSDGMVMGVILFALELAWIVVMIPIFLLLSLAGVVLGGLPGLLVGGIASAFLQGPWPWILGGVIAFPIFLVVVFVPLLFLGGLAEVFKSSTWTLTYREMIALEGGAAVFPVPEALDR